MRAGRRVLTLLPSFPLAHWLVATVHVARGALADAERELSAAIANQPDPASGLRFSAVALHWLRGLIHLARGDARSARADFARELANEASGHLYARECCANAWYAIGALELREGQDADADAAFRQALRCIATHPLASIAIARTSAGDPGRAGVLTVDVAIARGVGLVLEGSDEEAASLIDAALAEAPEGSAGWLLPVEPLLHVSARPQVWQQALTRLRGRAA